MYIAFKWLICLAVAMWLAMCCIDLFVKSKADLTTGTVFNALFENITIHATSKPEPLTTNYRQNVYEQSSVAMIHCYMFLAGALAVSIFNKKTEIILYTKTKVGKISIKKIMNWVKINMIEPVAKQVLKMVKCSTLLDYYKKIITSSNIKSFLSVLANKSSESQQKINTILLNKLKEVGEERKNLGQLLIAAIHENKNIRMQYQLESMAKTRLLRHIDDTNKQIKENRSRYVSFQHLYLVTHQENVFLKARVRKLQKDKEEAEKNLLNLINEVYKSKNKELKLYCSRFIVQTKDNLLNTDVSAEIRKFLRSQRPDDKGEANKSNVDENGVRITEILNEDDGLVPLVCDAPKLKGLPGEYVWTVKDKDGIIEKLYEYDYESDLDNGDTIRRIRKYSVYCDEECLLDYQKSSTMITDPNAEPRRFYSYTNPNLSCSWGQRKFLTGSRAFQRFLRENNQGVVQPPSSPLVSAPLQLSG